MGSDKGAGCLLVVAGFCMLFVVTLGMFASRTGGHTEGTQDTRAEAVERGYGEWVPDKNGKTTFRWKE